MKPRRIMQLATIPFVIGMLVGTGWAGRVAAQAGGPAYPTGGGGPGQMNPGFSYQGQLKVNGSPYTGTCDLQFSLWDSQSLGTSIGGVVQWLDQPVTNGLFTTVLNGSAEFDPPGAAAFQGDLRYLQTIVRCPAGAGSYIGLSPRQPIYGVPYALGLMPGTRMLGDAYQTLKIQNSTTQTGVPAGVTGEMKSSVDGVGVYGSNEVLTAGATGMGVWGRTWSPSGVGVKGTGVNGAIGVYAEGAGLGIAHPALYAVNTDTTATTPAGIGIYAVNSSADATIVARNTGAGDAFRVINTAGNAIVFLVSNGGAVAAAGTIAFSTLGSAGSTALCRNASNQIASCSSSARYKSNIAHLGSGLDAIAQLRPVTFDWNGTGEHDLGFVAEEVEQVAPLLATRNADGLVEGVKYDRLSAVLVKAMQEQQGLIAALQARNADLEARIAALEQTARARSE